MAEWYNAELFNITSCLFTAFKNTFFVSGAIVILVILTELAVFLGLKMKKEWL